MQDPQPEEYESADTRVDSAMTDDFPLDGYQDNDLQSASLPSDIFEPYHPDLDHLDLYSPSSSSSGFEPYHPDIGGFDPEITSFSSSGFEPYHPGLENLEPQLTLSSSSSFGPYHPDFQFLDLQHAAVRPKLSYGHADQWGTSHTGPRMAGYNLPWRRTLCYALTPLPAHHERTETLEHAWRELVMDCEC